VYGGDFCPSEIQIDGMSLLQLIQDLQNQIGSLQGAMNQSDPQIIDYMVVSIDHQVTEWNLTDIQDAVASHMLNGWVPLGGISFEYVLGTNAGQNVRIVCQTMVKYSE